jgi:hypothetical protein
MISYITYKTEYQLPPVLLFLPSSHIPISSAVPQKEAKEILFGFVKICSLTPTSDLVCTYLNTNFLNLHTDTTNTNWEYHESPIQPIWYKYQCLAGY